MRRIWMREKFQVALVSTMLLGTAAWGQQDPTQTPPAQAPSSQTPTTQTPSTPAPAFGQDLPAPQVTQAPPVTSLDQASLEPTIAARSYLQPGVHATESVNSNLGNNGGAVGITRLLGSLD